MDCLSNPNLSGVSSTEESKALLKVTVALGADERTSRWQYPFYAACLIGNHTDLRMKCRTKIKRFFWRKKKRQFSKQPGQTLMLNNSKGTATCRSRTILPMQVQTECTNYQGRSHSMLAWCTGTRLKTTFTTKSTNIYHISQEKFVCYLMGAPPQFLC